MFEYSLLHWLTFVTATVLLNLSPGPDMAFMLAQTVKHGKSSGFSAMFGAWAGTLVHVLIAAVGLSAVIATSAFAFSLVKWVGAAYLCWLGVCALRSTGSSFISQCEAIQKSNRKIFKQGLIVAILNPKVAIFFLAFLPQFVVDGAGPIWLQLTLHGVLIIAISAFIEPPLILLAAKLSQHYKQSNFTKWLDRSLGALFIALGIRLALSSRS